MRSAPEGDGETPYPAASSYLPHSFTTAGAVGDGGSMADQLDAEWMERVLQSQLIIRGTEFQSGLVRIVVLGAHAVDDDHRVLLTASLDSKWPDEDDSRPFFPTFSCSGEIPVTYFRGLLERKCAAWSALHNPWLARQQSFFVADGGHESNGVFMPHIGRLELGMQYNARFATDRSTVKALEWMIPRFNAFASASRREHLDRRPVES